MIEIENVDVHGFEAAIRGMRNPMNSWDKSDSHWVGDDRIIVHNDNGAHEYENLRELFESGHLHHLVESGHEIVQYPSKFLIGENDLKLMKQLVSAGSDHSKFMRMITVACDITAPMYWWAEADTYKVGTVRNSCSKMHKLLAKPFEVSDFSAEYTNNFIGGVVDLLNSWRDYYLETKDKKYWYAVLQLLPESYNQRATWQANYAVLRNIYHARKNHKLDEWHDFCTWIKSDLPYSELITEDEND
jgi:hypothetical protein